MYQGRSDEDWLKAFKSFSSIPDLTDEDIVSVIQAENWPQPILKGLKDFLLTLPDRQKSIEAINAKLTP